MSIDARIADNQPESFAFTRENEAEIKRIVAKYPKGRQASAVMPLLDLAQRQHDNWIPMKAVELIAKKLDMAEIRVPAPGKPGVPDALHRRSKWLGKAGARRQERGRVTFALCCDLLACVSVTVLLVVSTLSLLCACLLYTSPSPRDA